MAGNPIGKTTISDSQIIAAIVSSRSWRGVMRELGLSVTSPRSTEVIKRHADRLGLDTSHFTGQRRWSDATLRQALSHARSRAGLLSELGLSADSGSGRKTVRAHAGRLGLDVSHLECQALLHEPLPGLEPDSSRLRDAGTTIAAAWFLLRGCGASIPVEPAVYDLLVSMPDGIKRIQVKTTTFRGKEDWIVQIGRRPYSAGKQARLNPYDPDSLDFFFILDGDFNLYLIPIQVIAGRVAIVLRHYSAYLVGNASGLLTPNR